MATLISLSSNDTEYVTVRSKFISGGLSASGVLTLYHGTKHCCDITKLSDFTRLCQNITCGVCGIIRTGPRPNGFVWFGPSSDISHGYTGAIGIMAGSFRAIFVMDVVSATSSHGAYTVPHGEAALPRYLIIYSH
ncbi:hypothetical protein GLOIN_2v1762683 [Rhizophagus clarus]|uniref:Uncharacterized protein n=1 Tax=Rhizophagus clarus TaxID=94130 RepID=A0A8H3LAM8_9GLOM|nr:hypothetical protein GLOIN_2v1762683 [Rhizophagus clarus]